MNVENIIIREATNADFDAVMQVEKLAFGQDAEANLVADLLSDKSAKPHLSLLAFSEDEAIGHILFTKASIKTSDKPLMHLLAPMAVSPDFQRVGVGGLLIRTGLEILRQKGSELVFVLGHKTYYPKYGFMPDAGKLGFSAPYPIPEKDADAWMVQALSPDALRKYKGKIQVADKLMKPEYWVE